MHRRKPTLTALWHGLDEASFGAQRTLNLRELLPSAAEARLRAETWLRARQVTCTEEVLVITGRGNQSAGGVGVIRQEILALMPSLRRKGIVESWREHSPGSIIVKLAPVNALLFAARRKRDGDQRGTAVRERASLTGLEPATLAMLRQLASQNLDSLGVEASEEFIADEMLRTFSALVSGLGPDAGGEAALVRSIRKGLEEAGDLK